VGATVHEQTLLMVGVNGAVEISSSAIGESPRQIGVQEIAK